MMLRSAVEIEHAAKVTDGADVFGTTRELVIYQFWGGDQDVQIGVKLIVKGFQTFGLFHKAFIGEDNEVHIADTVKILVFHLADSLCCAIGTAVVGYKLIILVTHCLETEGGTTELTFHLYRIHGVTHVPNLGLLGGTGQTVFIDLINNGGLRVAEEHLSARHFQLAPGVDENVVHIAFRGGTRTVRIVFQGDAYRLAFRLCADPSAHFMTIIILGGRGGGGDGIHSLLHIVDQHGETGRLEIATRQSRLHRAGLRGNHIGETEVEVLT